ncbi:MAG: hypothetical protein D5R98_10550 [Desulfonatronovibrio sp. MSAO_Bac4]|nr:MAG: hypothetical protein D5R98_10550 [Desulfonatronovibrio sp. MSAO_Bac4]
MKNSPIFIPLVFRLQPGGVFLLRLQPLLKMLLELQKKRCNSLKTLEIAALEDSLAMTPEVSGMWLLKTCHPRGSLSD